MNTSEKLEAVDDGLVYDLNENQRHVTIEFRPPEADTTTDSDSLASVPTRTSRASSKIKRLQSTVNFYQQPSTNKFWIRWLHRLKYFYFKLGLKHLLPLLLLAIYSLIGAGAFYALESENEISQLNKNRQLIDFARRQMSERIWELKLENLSRRKVLLYANEALKWYDETTKYLTVVERQWDFWGAIFYCGTIYTTIGYGNIVPITFGGKLLTLFYAAFGIPLVFFILNDLGDVLGRAIYRVWTKIKKLFLRDHKKSRGVSLSAEGAGEDGIRSISTTTETTEFANVHDLPMSVALGITLAWMFLCSAVFCGWEDWNYFQAFHFFFVSLTTVGLGDTVPHHHNYMIMSFGLILLGLSLVSMCIQVVQAKVEHLAQQILEKLMKKYQVAQLDSSEIEIDYDDEDEMRNSDLFIEKTLDRALAPSWIRPLLSHKKKEKLMKELKKRTKMRIVGTQTDGRGGQKSNNVACQTEAEPNWKGVYEKKLTTAQDLLKELEQRYGAMVREQQREKLKISTVNNRRQSKLTDSADETISSIKNVISRMPTKRMTSLKEKLPFNKLRRRSKTIDATGENVSLESMPTESYEDLVDQKYLESDAAADEIEKDKLRFDGHGDPINQNPIADQSQIKISNSLPWKLSALSYKLKSIPKSELVAEQNHQQTQAILNSNMTTKSVVVVEERIDEIRQENRSAITRWIRRFAPKHTSPMKKSILPLVSIGCQTDDYLIDHDDRTNKIPLICAVCQNLKSSSTFALDESNFLRTTPNRSLAMSSDFLTSVSSIDAATSNLVKTDATSLRTNVAIQCGDKIEKERFSRQVPYALDDCKLLFGAIQKRLLECQSIINDHKSDSEKGNSIIHEQ